MGACLCVRYVLGKNVNNAASESMNAFVDKYINKKTTLKQFVEQYENALAAKVHNETIEDFNSFNSRISYITIYDMEKQF